MMNTAHKLSPQYMQTSSSRIEYKYLQRGYLILDRFLSDVEVIDKNLSLLRKDLKCILGDKYDKSLGLDEIYSLIDVEYSDLDVKHLFEFNIEFLRKVFSFNFFKVLKHIQENKAMPTGFPYLGEGYQFYESLVSSSSYKVSRVAADRFKVFFQGALASNAVDIHDHYVFLGPGTGHEISVLFDVCSAYDENFFETLGSLVLIDLSKSVLDATFQTIERQFSLQDFNLEYKALIGDFESIKIKPINSSYLGTMINMFVGFTSGNFNCQNLLGILDNLTLNGSQVVVDTSLYRERSDLDPIIKSYDGEGNKQFLLNNFALCLRKSGVSEALISSMYDSFSVDLVSDPVVSDFVSVQSSTTLHRDIIDVVSEKFNVNLPERLILMESYRRKAGALIDYLESNSFEMVLTRQFKGEHDSLITLIKKAY